MAEEYIKREDTVKAVDERIRQIGFEENPLVLSIRQTVREIPAADVREVRHGKWLWDGYVYDEPYVCNCCSTRMDYESNFCPNCGADMRG